MVTLTARCPYCEATFRTELQVGAPVVCCACQQSLQSSCPAWVAAPGAAQGQEPRDGSSPLAVPRCLACPSTELFIRKDFPQQLGVGIVVIGFTASSIAWYFHRILTTYGILFATALIDVVLYVVMGNVLECYRCHAQYRGLPSLEGHEGFNLEVHERYRQQAARLRQHPHTPAP